MSGQRLVLASGSPARRSMLANAGLMFDVVPADLDEDQIQEALPASTSPPEIARVLAENKALTVATRYPEALVIGSDQVLATGSDLLSKPGSREGARQTLQMLRGKTHRLHSAAAIAKADRLLWTAMDTAELSMRDLSDLEIERYLDEVGGDVYGCVGAYQIEGRGITLFESVRGDHFTILGLPLLPLLAELRRQRGGVL